MQKFQSNHSQGSKLRIYTLFLKMFLKIIDTRVKFLFTAPLDYA